MSKKHEIDELRWVRLFSPIHIPLYLVDQVRDRDYTVEDFMRYQEINCLVQKKEGPTLNPFNHLYALVDPENAVKGFLWFVIDSLSKDVVINTFSMDKAYWGKGAAVKRLSDHVKEIMKKLKLKKVYWLTNYPKHSERHGFKRSRSVLMEYRS
jgi:N-acetylglutamate synthase-like GNAT family acetyltransferase